MATNDSQWSIPVYRDTVNLWIGRLTGPEFVLADKIETDLYALYVRSVDRSWGDPSLGNLKLSLPSIDNLIYLKRWLADQGAWITNDKGCYRLCFASGKDRLLWELRYGPTAQTRLPELDDKKLRRAYLDEGH